MKESYLENEYASFWTEEGILYIIYKPSLKAMTLDIAKKLVDDRLKVSNNRVMPLFVDISNLRETSKTARDYLAEGDAVKHTNATALLVNNKLTRMLASIYMAFSRPSIPTKVFTDQEEAMKWLKRYVPAALN